MKKQINLLLVMALGLSSFSAFAQGAPMHLAAFQAQINNQYLKTLEIIKQQHLENIQRLQQQYQEQQRLLMAQLMQAQTSITNDYEMQLGQASAAQAVSIRKNLQDMKDKAQETYHLAMNNLKKAIQEREKKIKNTVESASRNAKKQLNAFLASAKSTGQAAVDAAVSGFAHYSRAVGNQLDQIAHASKSVLETVRQDFNSTLTKAGLLGAAVGQYIGTKLREAGRGIVALSQAAQTRLNNVQEWFTAGKDKLVTEVKQLNQDALALKNKLTAAGARPFSAAERAEIAKKLRNMSHIIGGLAMVGPIPVVAYHSGAAASFASRMYENLKQKISAPIQKVTNSWRQFKAKMNCFGNSECTYEQNREASEAFMKVFLAIYALVILVGFTAMLTAVVSQEVEAERKKEQSTVRSRKSVQLPEVQPGDVDEEESWVESPFYKPRGTE